MRDGSKTHIMLVNVANANRDDVLEPLRSNTHSTFEDVSADAVQQSLQDGNYDLILLNIDTLGEAEVAVLTTIRMSDSDLPVVVVSNELSPDQTRQLFRFNVQDWLVKPLASDGIDAAVLTASRTKRISRNRVHAVVSAVGGAGATTVAVSLADLLQSNLGKKKASVGLFDLDFSTGNCSYVLDMVNEFNIGSVVDSPQRVDSEFIRLVQQQHRRGFYLYSFKRPDLNTELNSYELVLRMLDAVLLEHEHTVLDIPYYETDWRDDVLGAVNTCTLVTELNLPALKHAIDMIDHVKKLRGDDFPLTVLINKRSGLFGGRIGKKKLVSLFGTTPFHFLPEEGDVLGEALDRGIVPAEIRSRNSFTKALDKFLDKVKLTETGVAV